MSLTVLSRAGSAIAELMVVVVVGGQDARGEVGRATGKGPRRKRIRKEPGSWDAVRNSEVSTRLLYIKYYSSFQTKSERSVA